MGTLPQQAANNNRDPFMATIFEASSSMPTTALLRHEAHANARGKATGLRVKTTAAPRINPLRYEEKLPA